MALQPLPPTAPPSSAIKEQELLEKLIKEGLDPSRSTPSASRTLIEVLFQNCIVKPAGRAPTQNVREQATFTLTILRRQVAARPQLLWEVPEQAGGSGDRSRLYTWILPRLIQAAVLFDRTEEARALVDDICSAAAGMLQTMRRDGSDDLDALGGGMRLVGETAKSLSDFANGEQAARCRGFVLICLLQTPCKIIGHHVFMATNRWRLNHTWPSTC